MEGKVRLTIQTNWAGYLNGDIEDKVEGMERKKYGIFSGPNKQILQRVHW